MPTPAVRVVSLLPSATEIVCALGLSGRLVGRSHECDYPAEVRSLPVCTRVHVDSAAASASLHAQVESRLQQGLSLYDVDLPLLRRLEPGWVLTQAQCEVCAVALPQLEAALATGSSGTPRILSLSPRRLADLWGNILEVAAALEAPEAGRALVRRLKERVADVILRTAPLTRRPTVACIEWIEPLMAAGNWVPELVELAGGKSVSGVPGEHSPWWDWAGLAAANPDIIVLMPCGFDLARTEVEARVLAEHPAWNALRAVRTGEVYAVDGNQFFNRSGPRLVDSIEILAEIVQPRLFPARTAGQAWRRWPVGPAGLSQIR